MVVKSFSTLPDSARLQQAVGLSLGLLLCTCPIPAQAAADGDAYMKAMQTKIKWMPPEKTKATKVVVQFTINPDGTLKDVGVPQTSGDILADNAAIAAIRKAAPFGPLPDKTRPMRITFTFNCSNSDTTSGGVSMKAYNEELWKKIQKTWWIPKRLAFFKVTLRLTIGKDGSLQDLSIEKPSGDKNADRLALIGIKRAAPFAPLPEGVNAPYILNYNLGFDNNHDPYFNIWNGERVNEGGSYTTAGGVKMSLRDTTTAKDQELHKRKEDTLIKMADLDEAMAKIKKGGGSPEKGGAEKTSEGRLGEEKIKELVPLMVNYADCQKILEEHQAALATLKDALTLSRQANSPAILEQALGAAGQEEYSLGKTEEAYNDIKEAVEIRENTLNLKDKRLKDLLETMGRLLYKQNRSAEADQYYARAKSIVIQ